MKSHKPPRVHGACHGASLTLCLSVQMDLTCFIAMMIFLQSANATFAAFAQGGNRITLDYNQFLYATANVV